MIHQRHRQMDRHTDGQTTCNSKTALCTVVHRAVKRKGTEFPCISTALEIATLTDFLCCCWIWTGRSLLTSSVLEFKSFLNAYKLPNHSIVFARRRQQHKHRRVTLGFATHFLMLLLSFNCCCCCCCCCCLKDHVNVDRRRIRNIKEKSDFILLFIGHV